MRFAVARLLYRLSLTSHRDRFMLQGGMLVTIWLDDDTRVTCDVDFLGHGDADGRNLVQDFREIISVDAEDEQFALDLRRLRVFLTDVEPGLAPS